MFLCLGFVWIHAALGLGKMNLIVKKVVLVAGKNAFHHVENFPFLTKTAEICSESWPKIVVVSCRDSSRCSEIKALNCAQSFISTETALAF